MALSRQREQPTTAQSSLVQEDRLMPCCAVSMERLRKQSRTLQVCWLPGPSIAFLNRLERNKTFRPSCCEPSWRREPDSRWEMGQGSSARIPVFLPPTAVSVMFALREFFGQAYSNTTRPGFICHWI